MNREGYKTPTEDIAIGREAKREKVRKLYKVREGDKVKMQLEVSDKFYGTKKVVRTVQVVSIHTDYITVDCGKYTESFQWWDFEKRRRDG